MHVTPASSPQEWDAFLLSQPLRPFLQSWTMGEVFRDIGQEPMRLVATEGEKIVGICQAILMPARRGRHLAVHYGPVVRTFEALQPIIETLIDLAQEHQCSFIRMSPFVPASEEDAWKEHAGAPVLPSPLHLLGEHIWYMPLVQRDPWSLESRVMSHETKGTSSSRETHDSRLTTRTEEDILMHMRKTTRNLIRRAEKDGVTVRASSDPVRDLPIFLRLHHETKARHRFTPYRDNFFHAQVARFAPRKECTLYLAEHVGQVLASSIHMHVGGETSYHHGASTMSKVPASTLLQWTAIQDALKRGDHLYSFWGIAPMSSGERSAVSDEGNRSQSSKLMAHSSHPFAGVTLFKMGFGGELLNLVHCRDLPLSGSYRFTRAFEFLRKWRRGF